MNIFLKNISRALIIGLIIFEFLNWLGILNFSLEFSWFGLIITCAALWIILESLNNYIKINSGNQISGLAYFAASIGIYIDTFGDISKFYGRFDWYDQFAHLSAGAIIGIIIFNILFILNKSEKIKMNKKILSLFTISLTSLLGSLYEIEEYLEDLFLHRRQLRLGDGPDTANDLMLNILGATLAIIIYYIIDKNIVIKKNF